MKTLALVICLVVAAATAKAQADYSESTVYVPRDLSHLIPSKKSKKQAPAAPLTATRTAFVSGPIPMAISVLDAKGTRITNLKKENFKIFVGDKEVEITSFDSAAESLDVVLLIDTSPSASLKPKEVQRIAGLLADQFGTEDRIMVAEFNARLKVLTDFTTDPDLIKKAIKKFSMGDGTALYDTVAQLFTDRIKTVNKETVILLVTDGVDTTSAKQNYLSSLAAVERSNVAIFPIYMDTFPSSTGNVGRLPGSIGNSDAIINLIDNLRRNGYFPGYKSPEEMKKAYEIGKLYLNDMVFATGGRAFTAPAFDAAPAEIKRQVHERYFVTVQPTDSMKMGERYPVRVRVNIPNLAVLARGSYIAK